MRSLRWRAYTVYHRLELRQNASFLIPMAISQAQKQQIVDLCALGLKQVEVIEQVGCSRATLQRFKKTAEYQEMSQKASKTLATAAIEHQGKLVVSQLTQLQEQEPLIKQSLFERFQQLDQIVSEALDNIDPQDVSPRQIPSMVKAMVELASSYAAFEDRITGIQVIASEIERLNQDR